MGLACSIVDCGEIDAYFSLDCLGLHNTSPYRQNCDVRIWSNSLANWPENVRLIYLLRD